MKDVNNLFPELWREVKRRDAVLVTCSCTGTDLVHGRAVDHLRSFLKRFHLITSSEKAPSRIALAEKGLILMGNPHDLCADPEIGIQLSKAGYPSQFEVIQQESGLSIRDRFEAEGRPNPTAPCEHVGFIFIGRSRDLIGRPTLLLTGSTPLGVLAAALWVTQSGLKEIEAPKQYPQYPIEVRVCVAGEAKLPPDLCDLETLEWRCGASVYDHNRKEWREKAQPVTSETPQRTQIRVEVTEDKTPKFIYIDNHRITVTKADRSRLLVLLIQRAKMGVSITMAEAQIALDAKEIPTKIRTYAARRSEIARLSKRPDFMEKTSREDGTDAFMLNADIVIARIGDSESR